jgi:hypothetical protein
MILISIATPGASKASRRLGVNARQSRQFAQPIQTGREASPPSNMTQTVVPTGGVAFDWKSRHASAQLGPPPTTDGTLTWIRPRIVGSAVFMAVPR